MAFKHPRHDYILRILQAMDRQFLKESGCYFSGGTAIAMAFGEKRLSFDIDFLANEQGIKAIRNRVLDGGLSSLFVDDAITVRQESRNAYSIKGVISFDNGEAIKLEIVHEARIDLSFDSGLIAQDENLLTIDKKTMIAQKFLAMCDRGLDVGFHSRDFWDLCVLAHNASSDQIKAGYQLACGSYGKSTVDKMIPKIVDLAIKNSSKDFDFLQIDDVSRVSLVDSAYFLSSILADCNIVVNESLGAKKERLDSWYQSQRMCDTKFDSIYQKLVDEINTFESSASEDFSPY